MSMNPGALIDDNSNTYKFTQNFFSYVHWMTLNDIENYKINTTPYMHCKYPPTPKLQSVSLYGKPF